MEYAVCAIIKDERLYLEEWIEHLESSGFGHIHLYEDYGSESHADIASMHSCVVLHNIAELGLDDVQKEDRQRILFMRFIDEYRDAYDWCAFIDPDEFIRFEDGWTLERLCGEFARRNGVMLCQKAYGANGHIDRPSGGMQENYGSGPAVEWPDELGKMKTIVNLKRPRLRFTNTHRVSGALFTNKANNIKGPSCYEKAWYDHYYTKSYQDWRDRFARRGDVYPGNTKFGQFFRFNKKPMHDGSETVFAELPARGIGIGNALWCILTCWSYGKAHGKVPTVDYRFFDEVPELAKIPFLTSMADAPRECDTRFQFDFRTARPIQPAAGGMKLSGYMQSYEYIADYVDEIRRMMKCPRRIADTIHAAYGDLSDAVCVHVRRGDYTAYTDEYNQPAPNWYLECAGKHYPGKRVFVVSDDVQWCKEHFGGRPEIAYADAECGALADFYAQTMCFANVCSCSTFSVMGAILNGNSRAVVPTPFFIGKFEGYKDALVPSWAVREYSELPSR